MNSTASDHSVPSTLADPLKGELVEWRDDKGFGFVRPMTGGRDYFVHISAFQKGLSRRPRVGDTILYRPHAPAGRSAQRRIAQARIEGLEVEPEIVENHSALDELLVKTLIAAPVVLSIYLIWRTSNPIPLVSYVFVSALTVLYYAADKQSAIRNRWRVPEYYLHFFEFLGGWPGALLARNQFRHKRKKPSYLRVFWSIVLAHGLFWLTFLYFDLGMNHWFTGSG